MQALRVPPRQCATPALPSEAPLPVRGKIARIKENMKSDSINILSHVVWLRGVNWELPRETVRQRILDTLDKTLDGRAFDSRAVDARPSAPGGVVQHAEAPGFGTARHHHAVNAAGVGTGGDHKGYALVSFTTSEAAEAALPILNGMPLARGDHEIQAALAPARLLPPGFPEHARYTREEWERREKREEFLVHRRVKMKRWRGRRREQHVQALGTLLEGIASPGGMNVLETYMPFDLIAMPPLPPMPAATHATPVPASGANEASNDASATNDAPTSCDPTTLPISTSNMHDAAQSQAFMGPGNQPVSLDAVLLQPYTNRHTPIPSPGPIALVSPGSVDVGELSINWACLPPGCQVSIKSLAAQDESGSESDSAADDGQPEMVPLRVLRKQAQVESFARALITLLPPPTSSLTSLAQLIPDPSTQDADLANLDIQGRHAATTNHRDASQPANTWPARQAVSQKWRAHVVEFGSGSGNLVLPLAALFPDVHFHAVDYKEEAVVMLLERAEGLGNVTAMVGRIEDFSGPMDVALALHACGSATDYAMLQAQRARAAYIVSPCCIGKLQITPEQGQQQQGPPQQGLQQQHLSEGCIHDMDLKMMSIKSFLSHPRSRWLSRQLPAPAQEAFLLLAQAGDISHSQAHSHEHLGRLAKAHVELDRTQAMKEGGYLTRLTRLMRPELHMYKSDLLLGVPRERVGERFAWPWPSEI